MSRRVRVVFGLVLVAVALASAAFAYIWVSGGSGEPTTPLAAPTVRADAAAEAAASPLVQGAAASESEQLFEIVPAESEVRFSLNEVLRGQPATVIARTDQVAGQILVNFAQPAQSQVGPIRVNVRTLATDNPLRDRAIRGQILQSAQPEFEFAQFAPTSVTGLPETVQFGQPVTLQITGDLTVRDVTRPVTFDTTVTPVSADRLEGIAAATVLRDDYGLTIPNVPGVADVTNEVLLEIQFVARALE